MHYDKLDNDELLRIALGAINSDHDAEALVMLKTLLERDPSHVFGTYLMAAQHAQLGMLDRAEAGFRAVMQVAPDFPMARFQLGQLLLVAGAGGEARQVLGPLAAGDGAVGAFARALSASAQDDLTTALAELEAGLALPQDIPALELDMRNLLARFQRSALEVPSAGASSSSALFLSNYGRDA